MHSRIEEKNMLFFRIVRRRRRVARRRRVRRSPEHYRLHKEAARSLVHERLAYWNQFYNHPYNRVAIKNTTSRWGSCSIKGNLNFNYRLALLPIELADYVIVHELCHLKEFNHAQPFWDLVAQAMPDYKERKARLREMNVLLIQGIQGAQ